MCAGLTHHAIANITRPGKGHQSEWSGNTLNTRSDPPPERRNFCTTSANSKQHIYRPFLKVKLQLLFEVGRWCGSGRTFSDRRGKRWKRKVGSEIEQALWRGSGRSIICFREGRKGGKAHRLNPNKRSTQMAGEIYPSGPQNPTLVRFEL